MEIKDFAAYGGLLLGLLNLGIYVYKEFFRRGYVEVVEEKFLIRKIKNQTSYAFSLDLKLRAKNDGISLNSIKLSNVSEITGNDGENIKFINLTKGFFYKEIDIEKGNESSVISLINERTTEYFSIIDTHIEKESNTSLSFAQIITNFRYSSGIEDVPEKNWFLVIDYDNKTKRIPINATILN